MVGAEAGHVGVVADVVAHPGLVAEGQHRATAPAGLGDQLDALEDAGGVRLAPTEVVDGAGRGGLGVGPQGADHVGRVDLVPHLLPLVAEHRVRTLLEGGAHEVAEEAVELDAGVRGPVRHPPRKVAVLRSK